MTSVKMAKGQIKELERELDEYIQTLRDIQWYGDLEKIELYSQMQTTLSKIIEAHAIKMMAERG